MFEFEKMKVKVTFTEDVLGMMPNNEAIYDEYIASKAPTKEQMDEEIEDYEAVGDVENQTTVFPRTDDGKPYFYDYQIKGFFKDSCGMLRRYSGSASAKIKAFKKIIDGNIFIEERKIEINTDKPITLKQRPLRASTPKGDRVALASSEVIAAGATMEFTILLLDDGLKEVVKEWLNYGRWHGMGQWRNASWGRFTYEIL